MRFISALYRGLDCITELTGKCIIWLTLLVVINTCVVVALRYFFSGGSIAIQESLTYIHATLFMLAMGYALKHGSHVRVDIFYRNFTPRTQALVDVLGALLCLLPLSVLIFVMSWDYVMASWAVHEVSTEGGGIKGVYLLKTLMLLLPVTLIIQGVAELLKNLLFFFGKGGSHTPEQMEPL
ncbi:MAG: TRAP transporter small permease subunit [Porticoccaceae bacterium]